MTGLANGFAGVSDRIADGYDLSAAVPQTLRNGVETRGSYKLPPESNSGKEEWGRKNPGRRKALFIENGKKAVCGALSPLTAAVFKGKRAKLWQ